MNNFRAQLIEELLLNFSFLDKITDSTDLYDYIDSFNFLKLTVILETLLADKKDKIDFEYILSWNELKFGQLLNYLESL